MVSPSATLTKAFLYPDLTPEITPDLVERDLFLPGTTNVFTSNTFTP